MGLRNLWPCLGILEAFLISLKSLSLFLVEGRGLRVSAFYAKGSGIFGLVVFCHFFQLLLVVEL